jgi:DNA-binding SARP family transcriptional activator
MYDRGGLVQRITRADAGLIALIAPAGFGKTTVARNLVDEIPGVAIYVDFHGRPGVVQLARTLIDALVEVSPGAAPALAASEIATGAVPGREWFTVVSALWRAAPADAVVVLDGLEAFRDDEEALAFLSTLLRQRGSRTVVLCSRPPLPIVLSKLAAPNEYAVFGVDELRLTDEEIETVLAGAGASPAERDASVQLTQGWPFAVFLLRRFAQMGTLGDFLARGGDQRGELRDYLLGEVLDGLGEAQTRLLDAISVLPRPTAEILEIVLERDDVEAELAALRSALPLVRLAPDGYRLHPLLDAVVRQRNEARAGAIVTAAAARLEAAGSFLDAADAYKSAGEVNDAVRCLERLVNLGVESPPTRFAHVAADLPFPVVAASPLIWAATIRARRLCADPQKLAEEGGVVWDIARTRADGVAVATAGVYALVLADAGRYADARALLEETERTLGVSIDAPRPVDAAYFTVRAFVEATQDRYARAARYYEAGVALVNDPHIMAGLMMHSRLREAAAKGEFAVADGLFDIIDEYASTSGMPITLAEALVEGVVIAWLAGAGAPFDDRLARLRAQAAYCASPDITAFASCTSEPSLDTASSIAIPRYRAYAALICAGRAADLGAAREFAALARTAAADACDAYVGVLAAVTSAIVDPAQRARHVSAAETLAKDIESEPLRTDLATFAGGAPPRTALAGLVRRLSARFPEPRLEFDAAGGRLWYGDAEIELSTNAQGMLLLLGNAPELELSSEELQDALWPESDAEAARTRLKMLVHRVRKNVKKDVLVARRSGYVLNCALSLSLADVERRLAVPARERPRDDELAELEALVAALEWRWPPRLLALESLGLLAERRSALRARAFDRLVDGLVRTGRAERAYEIADRFCQSDRHDEHAHEVLIRLAARTGRAAEARHAYKRYRGLMQREHGVSSPRTLA